MQLHVMPAKAGIRHRLAAQITAAAGMTNPGRFPFHDSRFTINEQ